MLDVRRLRILREVAHRGSFSGAADALYLSQSAVSQQVATLEQEIGLPLLERTRNGPTLTDAGERLVAHADAVLARLEEAERELTAVAGLRGGTVRLASFPSASATLVTEAVSEFGARHPEVELKLAEAEPEISLPELKRGEHDVVLVLDYESAEDPPDRDLERTLLLSEPMHVTLPREHRLADAAEVDLGELADETWLAGCGSGTCREHVIRACIDAGFDPRIGFESDDYWVLQGLVAAGLGVTLLPELALIARHPGIAVRPVAPTPPVRRIWAATLAAGSRSPATVEMVEILRETAGRFADRVAVPA